MNHLTIGVYKNGDFKTNVVKEEDLEDHIKFNKSFRFGRALFVDGKCIHKGYLNTNEIEEWTQKIKNMTFDISKSTEPYV